MVLFGLDFFFWAGMHRISHLRVEGRIPFMRGAGVGGWAPSESHHETPLMAEVASCLLAS